MFPTIDDVEAYHHHACIPLPNSLKEGAGKVTDQLKGGNVSAFQVDEDAEYAELWEEKLNLVMHTSAKTGKVRASVKADMKLCELHGCFVHYLTILLQPCKQFIH